MLDPVKVIEEFRTRGVQFFTGVPDSLLSGFCLCLADHSNVREHVIAANEGAAIGLAAGHYLGSGKPALVYMQNSGLGNSINPLVSLASRETYGIPMLIMIGWRGEPGVKDEPQHLLQGKITPSLLECLKIPFVELTNKEEDFAGKIESALAESVSKSQPFALLVRKGAFSAYQSQAFAVSDLELSRETAIEIALTTLPKETLFVSTTGKASRELYELRESRGEGHECDFLTVGSMGHASQIALGLCLSRPKLLVACLDGDGAAIMHMGSFAIIGEQSPPNFKHILINNGCHDSVGGQPTAGNTIDFERIATACNYAWCDSASSAEELRTKVKELAGVSGPALLEVKVRKGARPSLSRPKNSPTVNKQLFQTRIRND